MTPCEVRDENGYCVQTQRQCEFVGRDWGCGFYRHSQINEDFRAMAQEYLNQVNRRRVSPLVVHSKD